MAACAVPDLQDVHSLLSKCGYYSDDNAKALRWGANADKAADDLFDAFEFSVASGRAANFQAAGWPDVREQHRTLCHWVARISKHFAPTPDLAATTYSFPWIELSKANLPKSRARVAQLKRLAREVDRTNKPAFTTAVMIKLLVNPEIRGRLIEASLHRKVERATSAALLTGQVPPSHVVSAWCLALSDIKEKSGNRPLPAVAHLIAHETWIFYSDVLRLKPTVNANASTRKPTNGAPFRRSHFVRWSRVVAASGLGPIPEERWISALRNRRQDQGDLVRRLLARHRDLRATRRRFLPWLQKGYPHSET